MGSLGGASNVNIAVFGLGRMGIIHLENSLRIPEIRVGYLIEMDHEKAESLKLLYGIDAKILYPKDSHIVYEDPSVDGVVICTPTGTHADIAMAAIRAGKGVLCEKPLTTTIESTLNCYKEAEKRNAPLLCAFNRRFDPQLQDLYEKRGLVGRIESIKTCSRDSPRPLLSFLKLSGGMFHDCAVHDLDLIRWMIGEEPSTIYSTAHAFDSDISELNDVDTINIVMKFPSGILAHIDLSRNSQYGYHQTCEVFGSKGSLVSDNPHKSSLYHAGAEGIMKDVIQYSFKQRYAQAYIAEMTHFSNLLTGKEAKCFVAPRDTLRATFLAQAAEDSYRSGKVINLEDHFKLIFKNHANDLMLWEAPKQNL